MNTAVISVFLALFSVSSIAGTLLNKNTGESILLQDNTINGSVLMDATQTAGGSVGSFSKTQFVEQLEKRTRSSDEKVVLNILMPDFVEEVSELRFHRIYKNIDEESASVRRQILNVKPLDGEIY